MKYLWTIFIATGIGFFISGQSGALLMLAVSSILAIIVGNFNYNRKRTDSLWDGAISTLGFVFMSYVLIGSTYYGYNAKGLFGGVAGFFGGIFAIWYLKNILVV